MTKGESASTDKPSGVGYAEPKSDTTQRPVLSTGTLPIVTLLRVPKGIRGSCSCDTDCFHVSFFELNSLKKPLESIEVCHNAPNIYDQYLPRFLTGREGKRRSFLEVKTGQELNDILFKGTYFWRSFWNGRVAQQVVYEALQTATGLPRGSTLGALLAGPCIERGLRLLRNALTNVDGVLVPFYLSFQGDKAVNRWAFFDRMAAGLVRGFVHDTVLTDPNAVTYYERVKKTRNLIKDLGFKEAIALARDSIPDDLWFFREVVRAASGGMNPAVAKVLALNTQTRSIGLPPPQMRVAAYRKFYAVASSVPEPLPQVELEEVVRGAREVCNSIAPDRESLIRVMLRAQLEEKISLSSSAELDVIQSEGGKLEAARRLIQAVLPQEVIDLYTGAGTGVFITRADLEGGTRTPGEVVFMNSIQKFRDKVDLERLYLVRAIAVAAPGKYRIATASALEHAALLQPLAHVLKVCVAELESTRAGMTAGNHLWEFYSRIRGTDIQVASTEEVPISRELWFSSEDWEAASDSLRRDSSAAALMVLGRRFGLPDYYLRLCAEVLTHPRIVSMPANLPEDIPRVFISTSGVLMGDPATKIILQMSHNICRWSAWGRLQAFTKQSSLLRGFAPEREPGPTSSWEVDRDGNFDVGLAADAGVEADAPSYRRTRLRRRREDPRELAGAVRVKETLIKSRPARIARFQSLLAEQPRGPPTQNRLVGALGEFFRIAGRAPADP